MVALPARRGRRLTEALSLRLPADPPPGPGGLLGLELEFSVRAGHGARIPFGSLIHQLPIEGALLDPGDPNAYRCSWGGVITCDGAEAEIATPPVWTRPGFTSELQAWSAAGEAALCRALAPGVELTGYSAHFSAAMPARLNDRVCRLYADTFAAGLMLLTDRIDSPGLLLRPRPGRTELCGEFVNGKTLPAVAAFVAGTAKACAEAVHARGAKALLPPRLDVRLAPAVQRYGWYVDRRAFGTDLHAASRRTLLPRASGGTISAQSHLELAWMAARQALAGHAAESDLQAADAMIGGSLPLPTECSLPVERGQLGDLGRVPAGAAMARRPPPPKLGVQARPGFTISPIAATWDFVVFEAVSPVRKAYACIPRSSLGGFADALQAGALDDVIAEYLSLRSQRRLLSAHQQTRRPGLYDQLGTRASLIAPERDPRTGRPEPPQRGAKHPSLRYGKNHRKNDDPPKPRPKFWGKRIIIIGAVIAVLLAITGVTTAVFAHQRGPIPPPHPVPGLAGIRPSALSFAQVPVNATSTRSLTITDQGGLPLTVRRMRLAGPDRKDFLVSVRNSPGLAHRSGQAVSSLPLSCLKALRPRWSCTITVAFTPPAAGPVRADLRIFFAAQAQPRDIPLTGTGVQSVAGALTLTPAALPAAQTGKTYSQRITPSGGTPPYGFSVSSGTLPPGLSLDPHTGVISGTPTTAGSYDFTITGTDSSSSQRAGSRAYSLRVRSPAGILTLAPATLAAAPVGTPYTQQITASGGTPPYSFSVTSGTLPPGLSLTAYTPVPGRSAWVISGTPTTQGTYTFTVTATDSSTPSHQAGSQAYTLQVTAAPVTLTLSPASLPSACLGISYQVPVSARGGTPPYSLSVTSGTLPPGLSFDPHAGVISGTPTTSGRYPFTVTATDSSSPANSGSQSYTVPVGTCLN